MKKKLSKKDLKEIELWNKVISDMYKDRVYSKLLSNLLKHYKETYKSRQEVLKW
jgi:RNA:NAD 2'-phosphotransferase (TPT1/KptA family)